MKSAGEILTAFWQRFILAEKRIEAKVEEAEEVVVHVVEDVTEEVEGVVAGSGHKIVKLTRDFLHLEASGGILLMIAAVAAMIVANSPLYDQYHYVLEKMLFRIGFSDKNHSFDIELNNSILHWINDGMMAVFFFLVGLEIKREFLGGELASRDRIILPSLAAIGGMAVPAAIFWFLNSDIPENLSGWAIPAATDIAFALGVLSLLGNRVPPSLKILLLAIAIIDDIGAILIIAFFYAGEIWVPPLFFAATALVVLFLLNRNNVTAKTPYFLTTVVLWVAVLQSGIHATLAGVVAAMFIPLRDNKNPAVSPLKKLEHAIHPWVAFGILPLFAFANAGVPLLGLGIEDLFNPVSLGIAGGLFFGKQIGVFMMLWLAITLRISPRPEGVSWVQLYAVSVLCGIGFTMSLFIGTLAYSDAEMQAAVRIGVIGGSLVSALVGYLLLLYGNKNITHEERTA